MSVEGSSGYKVRYLGGVFADTVEADSFTADQIILDDNVSVNSVTVATTLIAGETVNAATIDTGQGANELYAMDQDVRSTDAVTFASVNTGQGANQLFPTDQNLRTTDAVTFNTLNTGHGNNELYAMDQNVRTTDAVTFLTVNTGQGDNELYAMDQNVQTTDAVTFASVDTGQGANQLYAMDQDVRTTDAPTFASVNTGQGDNELYIMDQDMQTTDAVTFASVNTGQGANELYAMDQDVTTNDDVTFNDVDLNVMNLNTSGDSDALLAMSSGFRGALLPRMTTAQREAIASVPDFLFVYDTDESTFYFYNQSNSPEWQPIHTPETKGWARWYFSSNVSVTGDLILTTQYSSGTASFNNISMNFSTGVITLKENRIYEFRANLLLQSFTATGLFYLRIIEASTTSTVVRSMPLVRNGTSRSDMCFYPSVQIDTNIFDNEIRLQFDHTGANFSCNSNFCQFFLLEL
jgi:hypothetical protein